LITLARKEEYIFDNSSTAWTVVRGELELCVYMQNGDRYTIGNVRDGDVFGEVQPVVGMALSDTVQVDKTVLSDSVSQSLWRRLSEVNKDRVMSYHKTIKERITEYLIEYAQQNGKQFDNVIVVKQRPSWVTLSKRFGCSREHLNRMYLELKKEGLIHSRKSGNSFGIVMKQVDKP